MTREDELAARVADLERRLDEHQSREARRRGEVADALAALGDQLNLLTSQHRERERRALRVVK